MCERVFTDPTSCTHANHFLTSSVSPTEKVAELSFVATLEDLGFVKTKEVIVSESLQVRRACLVGLRFLLHVCCVLFQCYTAHFSFYVLCRQNEPTGATQLPSNPAAHRPLASTVAPKAPILQRDTPEYRTALELERWKEEQEDLFDNEVKKRAVV